MIKANELRIGNWYYFKNPMSGQSYQSQLTTYAECEYLEAYGEPIPLTVDIILKCGFEDSNKDNPEYLRCYTYGDIEFFPPQGDEYKDREGITISCSDSYYDRNLPHIKHLHQLQNLYFALTGIELVYNQ